MIVAIVMTIVVRMITTIGVHANRHVSEDGPEYFVSLAWRLGGMFGRNWRRDLRSGFRRLA